MSKEKKRELNWYQANDSEAMARRLEKMAAKGWLLESVDSIWRTYRRDEPSTVRYAVTYIQDASQFNPGPTERQQTLEELCAAAGRLGGTLRVIARAFHRTLSVCPCPCICLHRRLPFSPQGR